MLLYVGNILIFHQFPKQYGSLAEALNMYSGMWFSKLELRLFE